MVKPAVRPALAYPIEEGMKIAIAIPCYQEALTIGKVVADFKRELPKSKVYVFDNNSTDRTVLNAINAGAIVREVPVQGKGAAVAQIFSTLKEGIIVIVDGDNTYNAAGVHKLIKPILDGQADMVVATRLTYYSGKSFRPLHFVGNQTFSDLISMKCRTIITDPFSGYRAIKRDVARKLNLKSTGFDIETEMTIKVCKLGHKIIEIPLLYGERPEGSVSKLRTFRDGWKILMRIFKS